MNPNQLRQDAQQSADAFTRQFRNPQKPIHLVEGLTPQMVLEKAGFKSVSFSQLPATWQEVLLANYKSSEWEYGVPFNYEGNVYDDAIFMLRDDEIVLYTMRPIGTYFTWARLEKKGDSVVCRNINHDSNICEMIGSVAYFEMRLLEGEETFPGERGTPLPRVAENTRAATTKLLAEQDS